MDLLRCLWTHLVGHPVSCFNMLNNDGGVIIENNIGRSNHFQILVFKDDLVPMLSKIVFFVTDMAAK